MFSLGSNFLCDQSLTNLSKLLKDGITTNKTKGSKFAKFMAETLYMFVKPTKIYRQHVIPSSL